MWITIGEHRFKASLINAPAAREFSDMLPFTLIMGDLNNNEKHALLPKSISTDEHYPKRIHNGDLMLWGNQTIVVFYKDFDTPYPYTRIGYIEDPSQLQQVLEQNNVSVIFSKN
ncbi:cyclophilin-like fold protein [Photobacterium sp. SP02]|uniref:cyclophilin-like fold protein n=1 Tax=Photobacterium sp. SP02 TaxID=3032280 RepID=UPI003144DE3F